MTDAVSTRETTLTELCINTVRTLAMDAVQKADSGHPGTPMALAPLGYVLWTRHLRHNPADPAWLNRDRFVLSCGHASMLLYSLLYLTGYDLPLEQLEEFRQWGSETPGHPEYGHTPGVETTTGPLGQGFGNAVGMALAEAHLAAEFNRPGEAVIDHRTYFIASDGDLMEGISHEAASFAGHLKLGKLIGFYDNNHITIDGDTALAYSDNVAERFEAYGWHVQTLDDGNDLAAIDRAIVAAKDETKRPSLIIMRTHIAYGSPNKHDTAGAHGSPLGEEEVKLTKENLGWPTTDAFYVPDEALAEWRKTRERGEAMQAVWEARYASYREAYPDVAGELERRLEGTLPAKWDEHLPTFSSKDKPIATRSASATVINAIAPHIPELIGGSADLTPSTHTTIEGSDAIEAAAYGGRNLHFGIREHAMGGVLNGLSLHGGLIPFGATFLIFSDYMRPPIRLGAMMKRRIIYVFTHDSIGLGEDGPTHQPVEILPALRVVPNLVVVRPADANETSDAWRVALERVDGPTALILSRQKLPILAQTAVGGDPGVRQGGYILAEGSSKPKAIVMASGSEVQLALEARDKLEKGGLATRVVSMPSLELFAAQPEKYRNDVLPPSVTCRVAVEAAHPMSWYRWVGSEGDIVGIETFGASAPYERIFKEYGITSEAIVRRVRAIA